MGEAVRNLTDPSKIAENAEGIYAERYKEEYEREHGGEFVVIDVSDGAAYRGTFAEEALMAARQQSPNGVFHLIRVGAPGAFRVSYVGGQDDESNWHWALRSER